MLNIEPQSASKPFRISLSPLHMSFVPLRASAESVSYLVCVCGCETSKLPCDVMLFTTVVSTLLRTLRPEVEQVTNSMKRPATKGPTKVNKGSTLKKDATRYPQFGRFVQGQCSQWKPLGFPQVHRAKLQLEVVTCHALLVVGTRLQQLTCRTQHVTALQQLL